METRVQSYKPRRITDLVDAAAAGATVSVDIDFDILPVDFHHGDHPFQAYIFLAHYTGAIDGQGFTFRKCYARGCPNNLCTHVSQAIIIANRYLERDRHTLKAAGIPTGDNRFTLDDMIVKFERREDRDEPVLTIPELVQLAEGGDTAVTVKLEFLPAVEHFASRENAQTFLSGEFTAESPKGTYHCHRCFACFPTQGSETAAMQAAVVANARLEIIYQAFERAGITFQKQFFTP